MTEKDRTATSPKDRAFTTQDLDLASFLACRSIEPCEIRPPLPNSFPNFAVFVFDPCNELDAAIGEWSGDEPLHLDLREFLKRRRSHYRVVRALRGGAR